MSLFPLILVLLSTVMHAGWNVLARRGGGEAVARHFSQILIVTVALGAVPAIWLQIRSPLIPAEAWLLLVASGICCGVYYVALAKAYAHEELNVAYPITRAIPVIFVGIFDVFLNQAPSFLGWGGMIIVVTGCIVVALRSGGSLSLSTVFGPSTLPLLGAALGTTGYSVLDKAAAELIVAGPISAAVYCYFYLAAGACVHLIATREAMFGKSPLRAGFLPVLTGAVLNFGAYWLILWAYQMSSRAGYVVACRQFSIVVGVLMAVAFLKERVPLHRWIAVGSITAGLVILSVWGE